MTRRFLCALFAMLTGIAFASTQASAHPHVFVVMKSEILYDASGAMTGVRHAWTFDDMFSAYATQGLESKEKGVFTREELASLAEVNVTSLKEYDFFTYAKAVGKKMAFNEPVDYWLEYKDSALTLHFTLPLKTPVKTPDMMIEVYDPTYFVDFSFAEKDAAALKDAPAQCQLETTALKDDKSPAGQKRLDEAFFNNPTSADWGAQFAQRIMVKCP